MGFTPMLHQQRLSLLPPLSPSSAFRASCFLLLARRPLALSPFTMSRQATINRGRNGPIQRFSLSQAPNLSATTDLLATLTSACGEHRREQLLLDPTKCYQFACVWGDTIGFLTRPEVYLNAAGQPVVIGSFSDTIGTVTAVTVPIADFRGSFTSLVRAADAEHFDLPRHPTPAADLPGPPDANADAPNDPVEGTLGRLNFGDAADASD